MTSQQKSESRNDINGNEHKECMPKNKKKNEERYILGLILIGSILYFSGYEDLGFFLLLIGVVVEIFILP